MEEAVHPAQGKRPTETARRWCGKRCLEAICGEAAADGDAVAVAAEARPGRCLGSGITARERFRAASRPFVHFIIRAKHSVRYVSS